MVTNNACDEPTAAIGKVLQGQGVGVANAFSTATYPSTATGTGTILRADGTNWVASTATYPDTAGSSNNVLTSDGTNWVSSAPSGGAIYNGFLGVEPANPADSTTYYFAQRRTFIQQTSTTNTQQRFFVSTAITLNKVYANFNVAGTLGSNENCTFFIRVNDTTNTNISTTVQLNSANVIVSNSSLGISLNPGDYFMFGFTCPAWATNPTTVSLAIAFTN